MPKQKQVTQQAVTVSRTDMLEAFTELVGERWGYWMGRRLSTQEMTEATKDEAKAVRETRKALTENITTYIDNPSDDLREDIHKNQKTLEDQKKVLKEKRSPYQKKIAPLAKAVRYCDTVAIPDSLKELGSPVAPRFSLSEWITDALEASKKRK